MACGKNGETISPSRRWLRRTGCTNRPEFDHTLPLLGRHPGYDAPVTRCPQDVMTEIERTRGIHGDAFTLSRDRTAVPEVHAEDVSDFSCLPPIQTRWAMGKYHRKGYRQVAYGHGPRDSLPFTEKQDTHASTAQDTKYQRLQTPSDPMRVQHFHVQILESDHFRNRFDSIRHDLTDAHMRAMKMLLGINESDTIPGFPYPACKDPSPVSTKTGNKKRERKATRVKNKERR